MFMTVFLLSIFPSFLMGNLLVFNCVDVRNGSNKSTLSRIQVTERLHLMGILYFNRLEHPSVFRLN
jgi:hypothetical protein